MLVKDIVGMLGNKLLNGDAIPKSAEVTGVEGLPGPYIVLQPNLNSFSK
jgi:hypothetical protein